MPGALDLRNRDALFAALEAEVFDLAVIGAGITGAGVARDAALRGLRVALIDARDFAAGTSSRSSKMIHGGLRYLAQGDLALVREAASERAIVQQIAPHLARETPFVIPAKNIGAIAKLRAGLWAFEKLGGVPKSNAHEVWSAAQLRAREPTIAAGELAGAVVYPEYLTDDARLTLANVRSAAADGAVVANYAAARGIIIQGGVATGVEVADTLAWGEQRTARLMARVIVNAAGPWADGVRVLEDAGADARLQLARGVHLVVPHARLPVGRTIIMNAADGRGVFAVPRGQVTYLGTTDTFHPAAQAWPPIRGQDVEYLLAATNRRFCVDPLTAADIVTVWSGVRPLVAQAGKSASEISRRDELWTGPAGMISIAGGKLTAYRKMAQRVVDDVETALGRTPQACRTATTPLIGGDAASDIAGLPGGVAAQAVHAVQVEGAATLEDWWARRSGRAFFDLDAGMGALQTAADAMAPLLGWSPTDITRQIATCRDQHARDMEFL